MCCRYYILPKSVEWDPIREGAERLGWELDKLLGNTLAAMAEYEAKINAEAETI